MKPSYWLGAICLGALALRLVLLGFVEHPGIADPNHYYNLALRLTNGYGFSTDYIWHFYNPSQTIIHPDDFWMPLTGVIATAPIAMFGESVQVALLPFVLMGSLLPLAAYWATRQFGCTQGMGLFAAGAVAFLPEVALYSLRTDSVVPMSLFLSSSILLFTEGLRRRSLIAFTGSGVMLGLAYLTRSDGLLLVPALVVTWAIYARWGRDSLQERRLWAVAVVPLMAVAVALPWLLRNVATMGTPMTPNLSRMFFMTQFNDHYAYGRDLTLQTLLASQSPGQIIGKRLFEMAASLKIMYTSLDVFLPVAIGGGFILLIAARDRKRLLTIAPTLIFLGGLYVFYTVLAPFGSQGGSFKKMYVVLIPLLLPLAALALERAVIEPRLRYGVAAMAVGFMALNAFEATRADIRFTSGYLHRVEQMAYVASSLPDANGDGKLVLMAQDPFMLRFVGLESVVFPEEDRDTILNVARRYGIDYLLMPPARAALDAIYNGSETDPRLTRATEVRGTEYIFFRVSDIEAQSQSGVDGDA